MTKQKYMPKQRDRIEQVMNDRLAAIKLGDNVVGEAAGPQAIIENGQVRAVIWNLMITLAHNRLIGAPPVIVHAPFPTMEISDEVIVNITERMLEEARKIRARAESPKPDDQPDAAAMMRALQAQSKNGGEPAG